MPPPGKDPWPDARPGPGGRSRRGRCWPWLATLMMIGLSAFGALEIGPELIARIQREEGAAAAARIEDWQRLIDAAREFEEREKLERVNQFF